MKLCMKNLKHKKAIFLTSVFIVILMTIFIVPIVTPYNDHVNGSWMMYVYETDNPIQDRGLSVGVYVYVDDTNLTDDIEYNDFITNFYASLEIVPLRDRFNIEGDEAYMAGGNLNRGINMSEMYRWHFVVAINEEGESDFNIPENNLWYGEIHLNQYVNRFTWNVYRAPYELLSGYNYGVLNSHDKYTMELRFFNSV